MVFSKLDEALLLRETKDARIRLSALMSAMLLEGLKVEAIVLGMLKVASVMAKKTGCSEEIFIRLAKAMFKSPGDVIDIDDKSN